MLSLLQVVSVFTFLSQTSFAYNFAWEGVQLKDLDTVNNTDIAFGELPVSDKPKCKKYPGDNNWPSSEKWEAFNETLEGALVQGIPPAAACYDGKYENDAKCESYREGEIDSMWVKEDPVIPFGLWQLDNSCPLPDQPEYSCNITAFPAYVVVATNVKHVQAAVNFARNNNIRLTIKNTGHDFLGRNTGGGALQVYVHHLKDFEYLPSIKIAEYEGQAARVGVALEQFEIHRHAAESNITILAPGSTTVGAFGGFMQGGGFSTTVTSKLGLMADQVLSLEVVTADGKFVHASPEENTDLFWAIRGGGPGNFGIVTSAVIKVYPPMSIATSEFRFQTSPARSPQEIQVSKETFWEGVYIYFSHLVRVNDAKGVGWNNVLSDPGNHFSFQGQVNFAGVSKEEAKELARPIADDLKDIGINITNPEPSFWETYPEQAYRPGGPGEWVRNGRFVSRLFPRSQFVDSESEEFLAAMKSVRAIVEDGGYGFHSVDYHPSYETAGYPGADSAVSPHLRRAIMHATVWDNHLYGPDVSREEHISSHARLASYAQGWRDASPGSGAYMNEADTEEPNFQESFYGENYERLLEIKKKVDPWSVFYAVTGVGSEEWEVVGKRPGLPTQQGRLCRVD